MRRIDFLTRLAKINVWRSGGRRAPHKPLLVLYALGRVQRGKDRLVPYCEVEEQLTALLRRFGLPGKSIHPEFPFGRLPNDQLWEIPGVEKVSRTNSGDLHKSSLIQHDIHGGLTEADYEMLLGDDRLTQEAANSLLDAHFPPSMHGEIRDAVGLSEFAVIRDAGAVRDAPSPARDPAFRPKVLRAYEYRCAVCDYDIRLGDDLLGLEAAHVKWWAYGGPDQVQNGLALCGFHHKALDRGAWGLEAGEPGYRILISSEVHGRSDAVRWLRDYRGKGLRVPQRTDWLPDTKFVRWHTKEVFRRPAV